MADISERLDADGAVERASRPAAEPEPAGRRRSRLRVALMLAGPLLVAAIGAAFYLAGLGYVSTENAYVQADIVEISAEVSGRIEAVLVEENQRIEAGAPLFRLDDDTFRAALVRAAAQLDSVENRIESDIAEYRQKGAELTLARSNAAFAAHELERLTGLARSNAVSEAALDAARHELEVARDRIAVLEQERAQVLARLGGDPDRSPQQHPDYIEAAAARRMVEMVVARCTVRAPFAGVASNTPEPGAYVAAGAPVMTIVATDDVWVQANFKETALTHVEVGQPVSVSVDAYPDRVFEGTVESISPATGAEFSVLPPQNATGNWVKIVQRIPLRVALSIDAGDPPLRAGMSAEVEIDTGERPALLETYAAGR